MPGNKQSPFLPGYIGLYESGQLQKRADQALAGLEQCRVCPWHCDVNRLEDEKKICRTGRYARVSSCFAHQGEEDCLRGSRGSGTIFFSRCNLNCVFCQNHDISQADSGVEVEPDGLALMMIELQNTGCHNINFVTPEHVVPQILEALPAAVRLGLRLPIVYNTGGFDSVESLKSMDGLVDIYMPDFKYWDPGRAKRFLKTDQYPEAAKNAFKEMHRQVGTLQLDENGLAQRGVLVRHLVMPGGLEDTREIMGFLAGSLSADTFVNIMAQYRPAGQVSNERYSELNRGVTAEELDEAYRLARAAGLHRFDGR
jgi:putative pyruvate formate lyase activating enzyme